jgi:hypothetical protein
MPLPMSKPLSPEHPGLITPEPLNLSPQLAGLPLTRPSRRAFPAHAGRGAAALMTTFEETV